MQQHDTCGTCAGRHHTPDCKNGDRPRCISCQMEGHASWSRECPVFIHKCEEMNDRLTENYLPYFPMEEAWTHVSCPPKPARQAYSSTQEANWTRAGPRKTGYHQSTLQFLPSQRRNQTDKHAAAPPSGAPAVRVDGLESNPARSWADNTDGDAPFPSSFD